MVHACDVRKTRENVLPPFDNSSMVVSSCASHARVERLCVRLALRCIAQSKQLLGGKHERIRTPNTLQSVTIHTHACIYAYMLVLDEA